MDPASFNILVHNMVPVLAMLVVFGAPVGIVWVVKSHKLRMRELDIEEKGMLSRSAEARLAAVEQRLGAIESALGVAQPRSLEQRASLMEGPASSAPALPEGARLKQR
jgi:hypothetical protein